MAVAIDAIGPSGGGGANWVASGTLVNRFAHVNSDAANAIVVGFTYFSGTSSDITAVQYGGVALSRIGQVDANNTGGGGIDVWGKQGGLPTGSNQVAVTNSVADSHNAGSVSFTGTRGLGTGTTNFTSATSVTSTAITTTLGGMLIAVACNGALSGTFTSDGTIQYSRQTSGNSGSDNICCATKTSSGASQTIQVTRTSDLWGIVAVEVLPSAPPTGSAQPGGQTWQRQFRRRQVPVYDTPLPVFLTDSGAGTDSVTAFQQVPDNPWIQPGGMTWRRQFHKRQQVVPQYVPGITLLEEKGGSSSSTTATVNLGVPYQAGGDLLVIITYNTPATSTFTLDGTTILPSLDVNFGGNMQAWSYSGAVTGSQLIVTGTNGNATFAIVSHFRGFTGTPVLDKKSTNSGTGTALSSGSTGTLTHPLEAVAGAIGETATTAITGAGPPWTEAPQQVSTFSEFGGAQVTPNSTDAINYQVTAASSVTWKAMAVTYYDVVPAPVSVADSGAADDSSFVVQVSGGGIDQSTMAVQPGGYTWRHQFRRAQQPLWDNYPLPVFLTDSGTGTDSITESVTLSLSDAGAADDSSFVVSATIPLSDTGAADDSSFTVSATVPLADTGTGTDSIAITQPQPPLQQPGGQVWRQYFRRRQLAVYDIPLPYFLTDTGAADDSSFAVNASVTLSDTGAGDDSSVVVSATVPLADTGTGTDTLTPFIQVPDNPWIQPGGQVWQRYFRRRQVPVWDIPLPVFLTDAGTADDSSFAVSATVPLSDTGAADDSSFQVTVQPIPYPTQPGSYTWRRYFRRTQQLAPWDLQATPATPITLSDTGAANDSSFVVSATIPLTDTGAGADSITESVTLSLSDAGTADDSGFTSFQQVPDTPWIQPGGVAWRRKFRKQQQQPLWDSYPLPVFLTESGTGTDSIGANASVPLGDNGSGSDSPGISATVPVSDAGVSAESMAESVTLSLSEAGVASDSAVVAVSVSLSEVGVASDGVSVINVPSQKPGYVKVTNRGTWVLTLTRVTPGVAISGMRLRSAVSVTNASRDKATISQQSAKVTVDNA